MGHSSNVMQTITPIGRTVAEISYPTPPPKKNTNTPDHNYIRSHQLQLVPKHLQARRAFWSKLYTPAIVFMSASPTVAVLLC